MPRLSIDVTPEQHQKLKAIAALSGRSIKDYVLERSLAEAPEEELIALSNLEQFLAERKKEIERGEIVQSTAQDIFSETLR